MRYCDVRRTLSIRQMLCDQLHGRAFALANQRGVSIRRDRHSRPEATFGARRCREREGRAQRRLKLGVRAHGGREEDERANHQRRTPSHAAGSQPNRGVPIIQSVSRVTHGARDNTTVSQSARSSRHAVRRRSCSKPSACASAGFEHLRRRRAHHCSGRDPRVSRTAGSLVLIVRRDALR
jgi:hypothetical protein